MPRVILKYLSGSRLYGVFNENSDYDYRGVFARVAAEYSGLKEFDEEIRSSSPDDLVLYDLKKYFKLLRGGNPNIVESLFVDEKFIISSTVAYDKIRDKRQIFFDKKTLYNSFLGYFRSQLGKINNHGKWLENFPDVFRIVGALIDSLKSREIDRDFIINHFDKAVLSFVEDGYEHEGSISLEDFVVKYGIDRKKYTKPVLSDFYNYYSLDNFTQVHGINQEDYKELKFGKDSLILSPISGVGPSYAVKVKIEEFNNLKKSIADLYSWATNRSGIRGDTERKFGYDIKHGYHSVRLLDQIADLLEYKEFNPTVTGDRLSLLKDIRGGLVTYEDFKNIVSTKLSYAESLYDSSSLGSNFSEEKIEELFFSIIYGCSIYEKK